MSLPCASRFPLMASKMVFLKATGKFDKGKDDRIKSALGRFNPFRMAVMSPADP